MSVRRTPPPSLGHERDLLSDDCEIVAGLDEVGRGAWAGPVVVGAVAVCASTPSPPEGVRDSKELAAPRREALVAEIDRWCVAWSVGRATPGEIDTLGIVGALSLAARRALDGLGIGVGAVLLDGRHDYLSPLPAVELRAVPRVHTIVRGDRACASIAAASILAKVARDAEMSSLGPVFPTYRFHENKGYGTRAHADAVRASGLTPHHRSTWSFAGRVTGECGG